MFFEPTSTEHDPGTEVINNFKNAFGLDRNKSRALVGELIFMGINPSIQGDPTAEFKLSDCFQLLKDGNIKLSDIGDEESDLYHAVYSLAWDCICGINLELKENGFTDFDFSNLWNKAQRISRDVVIETFKLTALNFAAREAAERTKLLVREAIINRCGLQDYIDSSFQEPQRITKEDFFKMTRYYSLTDRPTVPLMPSKKSSVFSKS